MITPQFVEELKSMVLSIFNFNERQRRLFVSKTATLVEKYNKVEK